MVIDFRKIHGQSSRWVMGHVRADQARVVAEIEQAGFELLDAPDLLARNFFLRFRKR